LITTIVVVVVVIIVIAVSVLEWAPANGKSYVAFANPFLHCWIFPAASRERLPRLGGLTIKSNPSLRVVGGFEYLQAMAGHGLGWKQSPDGGCKVKT